MLRPRHLTLIPTKQVNICSSKFIVCCPSNSVVIIHIYFNHESTVKDLTSGDVKRLLIHTYYEHVLRRETEGVIVWQLFYDKKESLLFLIAFIRTKHHKTSN
jgi:hypothetical protein